MKKRIIFIAAIAFIIILVALILLVIRGGFLPSEYRIFGTLDELSCLNEYVNQSIEEDNNLIKGLAVAENKCVEVNYNGGIFKVYAYVFTSSTDASDFITRARRIHKSNGSFYMISDENRALYIEGSNKSYKDFMEFLFDHLTVRIDRFGERIN